MPAFVAAPPQRLAGRPDDGSTLVRPASGSPQGCIAVVNRVRSSARLPGSDRGQGPMGLWANLRGHGPAIDHARFVVMRIKGGRMASLLPAENDSMFLVHQNFQTPKGAGPVHSEPDWSDK